MNQEEIKKLLDYDENTGLLTWKKHRYPSRVGKLALEAKNSDGYKQGFIGNKQYKAHRIIWLWYYGSWPSGQIDHINGKYSDNRIKNLRDVSHKENHLNMKRQSNNTSGYTGVLFDSSIGKWRAFIYLDGKRKHLGYKDNPEEAFLLRKEAEEEYNFHKNHGRD